MMAGHFRQNHESSGDLNRGRRTESRVLFGYFLHDAKSDNSFSLQRTSRFSKPRFSSPQWRLRTNPIKSFCRPCLLETWSPCSRPFAILPVSAVSDAQKLATGNFLHVRAGSFEVLQTSNQRTQVAVSHRPIKFLPLRGKYKRHVKRVVFCRKSS